MKPDNAIQIAISQDLSFEAIDTAREQLINHVGSPSRFLGRELHRVTPNSSKYDGNDEYKNSHLRKHKSRGEWELIVSPEDYFEAIRLAPQRAVSVTCDPFMDTGEWLLAHHDEEGGSFSIWSPGA